MGKRFGSGGARRASYSSSVVNRNVLGRRIESSKLSSSSSSAEDIVDYLRSNFPDYSRIQQQPFKRCVEDFLLSRKLNNKRRVDEREENLRSLEDSHLRRRLNQRRLISSSSSSDSPSSSEEGEDDDVDGAVSTSEDAIYGQEVKPEFDITKSMLRANYIGSSSSLKKPKLAQSVEKNVELEIATSKGKNKVGVGKEGKASVSTGGGGLKEGPKFRDLGGMDGVLDELMMEVLVPFYHPQLPRWLGVRPISGILLHGPPGCGKTKLSHAIANETGVPFYKISATDVVSGVSGMALVA